MITLKALAILVAALVAIGLLYALVHAPKWTILLALIRATFYSTLAALGLTAILERIAHLLR